MALSRASQQAAIQSETPSIMPSVSPTAAAGIAAIAAVAAATTPKNNAVLNLTAQGQTQKFLEIPRTFVTTLVSLHGAGAVNTDVFLFNEDTFKVTPTTNGSAANSITRGYSDGFQGKHYNKLAAVVNGASGVMMAGFNVQCKDQNGNDDAAQLAALQMVILDYDGYGNGRPTVIDFSDAARNNQFKDGLYTIDFPFFLDGGTQIKVTLLGDNTTDHHVSLSFRTPDAVSGK